MSKQRQDCDEVIVVGSGLNGLMLALTVAEAGVHVHLIDRGNGASETGGIRTTTINPAAHAHLDSFGVWDECKRLGHAPTPIAHIRVSDEKTKPQPGRIVADSLIDWHEENSDQPLAYTFRNIEMIKCLYGLVVKHSGITMTSDCAISAYHPIHPELGDTAAMISTDDGQNFAARLIIAADGGNSLLRQSAGMKGITRRPGQTAIVVDILCEKSHRNMAWQRFIPGGPVALIPTDSDRKMSLVWTMKDDDAQTMLTAEPHAFNAALMDSFSASLGALTLDSERLSWPLTLHHVIKPHTTRMVLAGDAAHQIHPLAGQGYNLGIGDATIIATLIRSAIKNGQDIGSSHVLRRYSRSRAADVAAMTVMTDGLNAAFSFGGHGIAVLTGMGMTLFGASPLKKLAEKFARG